MAHSSTTPALTRIAALEDEREQLYTLRWREPHEIARLVSIRTELAKAWDARRLEQAGEPDGAMPDNVRSADEFTAPRGSRPYYRSRRRSGRTWAEAEALAAVELGR